MKKIGIIGVIALMLGLLFLYTNSRETSITLQTPREPLLAPHQHDTGDSILNDDHHVSLLSKPYVFQEDTWVTGIEFMVHNAPSSVIHHINLFQLNKPDPFCPNEPRLLAAFAEDNVDVSPFSLPPPYGMKFSKNDTLALFAMLHNPLPPLGTGNSYENVYVTITLRTAPVPTNERNTAVDFYLMHLEETPCNGGNYVFTVPPHTEAFVFRPDLSRDPQPGTFTFPADGEIIYIGSHLHGWEGGKELRLYMNGAPLRTFQARHTREGTGGWRTDEGFDSVTVKQGDTLVLEALYENLSVNVITGAMGMLGFFFAPQE